ncbi:sensor histidine kinase [Bailinhaonella thermotolerans]|uniref:Sensor-like histidine kinase SenX3 n=2 Tax=Bailinhaonella thermotolerans TaxID=1070861 RepID=A0A3A4BDK1_9ACTN|nr:sensor histidine kinase [Bailinhaonella thermotolerans]
MPLGEILWIVFVACGVGGIGLGLGLALLRATRHRSIAHMLWVVAVVTVVSMQAGILWITFEMIVEGHARDLVLTVTVAAGLVGAAVSAALGRKIVAANRRLLAAVRDVPDGGFVPPGGTLPGELAALSDAFAVTYERLGEARSRERALESSRRELVAWVSHDLRTPLAGLRAMAEALEDGVAADPETVTRYHSQIRQEADRLAAMVDDLFELSRIHAGALRLSRSRVGLDDLLADTLAGVEPLARAKGVRLTGSAEPALPVEVDAAELGRALRNLVVNAVRHTPDDAAVTVSATARGETVTVTVADSCGGIPEEDLPRVFDVAFRGEAARTPGGGAGLGLAIARGIVEAHDGVIGVTNTGPGCAFTIQLPRSA